MTPLSVPLRFSALEAVPRRGEPVTVGLPWPRGAIRDDNHFALIGPDGTPQVLQTEVLDRWPDGSIRWCLYDFLATWDGVAVDSGFRIEVRESIRTSPDPLNILLEPGGFIVCVVGGIVEAVDNGIALSAKNAATISFHYFDSDCQRRIAKLINYRLIQTGCLRTRIAFDCDFDEMVTLPIHDSKMFNKHHVIMDIYGTTLACHFSYSMRNEFPAVHLGGNWDLGAPGAWLFGGLHVLIDIAIQRNAESVQLSLHRGTPSQYHPVTELNQASSGGHQWKSANHISRKRTVDLPYCGYSFNSTIKSHDTRANPIASIALQGEYISVTSARFWEEFPKSILAHSNDIEYGLFPKSETNAHELQGGEQKTHEFTVAYGPASITNDPLVWARSPITVTAPPEWYAASGAMPYLTPKASDPNPTYLGLVDQAIEGPDTFYHKREKIDEYGWRHFGDIWGDHEAVYHPGPEPMVSHYNNQYDCVLGFLSQYLRSGDVRWLRFGLECADHTCDIDVYHTTKDKSAYNGGLFWHTYHYAPADTGTHRSYPKSLRTMQHFDAGRDLGKMGTTGAKLKANYAIGGGPSAAHNYNAGLMLAYFLTGKPMYKETAVGLADFVLNMDDGSKTIFRWLSRADTGLSIQSSDGYLGPGRASANSLIALLVGHRLTGDAKYLAKAEQVVRRVVHPKQNLESLDLLNAELRWFYTMFLQALGQYLDYKVDLGQLDENYAYARLSLLHYARYMAEHEHPILDHPEKLQYPTETWAAQDMRKMEVFQYAAKHATGEERNLFLEKAEWFFRYVERTLDTFPPTVKGIPTKSLCRPVVLMMNFGWSRNWWRLNPDAAAPEPTVKVNADQYGEWRMFMPQKEIAIRRAKILLAASGVLGIVILSWLLYLIL